MVSAPYAGPRPSPRRPKARSATATRSSAACCDLSPVSQAAPDLQEQLGCVRSCPFGQTRTLTPIWESSDASGTLVSLIDSFGEQLSQVFMLRVFDVDTNC